MVNLLLLPFRGIVWLFLGLLCSLPWVILLLPLTGQYWLPYVLSHSLEKTTHAIWRIEKAKINPFSGEFDFCDVAIENPSNFYSSDGIKIKNIHCKLEMLSFFSNTIHINELKIGCQKLCSIKQGTENNLKTLEYMLSKFFKKKCIIDCLKFDFNGLVASRCYDRNGVHSSEYFTRSSYTFSSVCSDADLANINTTSLQKVYNTIGRLFNERN